MSKKANNDAVAIESQSPPAPVSVSLLDEAHRAAAEVQAEAKARAEEYLRLYEVTDAMGRINPVPVLLCRGGMLFTLGLFRWLRVGQRDGKHFYHHVRGGLPIRKLLHLFGHGREPPRTAVTPHRYRTSPI